MCVWVCSWMWCREWGVKCHRDRNEYSFSEFKKRFYMDFSLEEADNCSAWYLVYHFVFPLAHWQNEWRTWHRQWGECRQQRNSSDAVACIFSGNIFVHLIFIWLFQMTAAPKWTCYVCARERRWVWHFSYRQCLQTQTLRAPTPPQTQLFSFYFLFL